jgi:hypothetical protein
VYIFATLLVLKGLHIRDWMYPVGGKGVDMRKAMDKLIDNWQTRWYTNACPCDDLVTPPIHDSHPNYSYWRSGCRLDKRQVISPRDLHAHGFFG